MIEKRIVDREYRDNNFGELMEATVDEIPNIEGITRENAQPILTYRENKKGKIESLDELRGLNGIDLYLLENVRDGSNL